MNQVATIAEENEWSTVRLKTLLMSAKNGVWGAEPRGDGSDTLCIRVADFDRDKLTVIEQPTTYRYVEKKDLQGRTVRTGDLLLEKSGGGEKTLVGMAVRYRGNEAAVCSNFVSVVRPREGVSSNWLNYLFFSLYSRRINYRSIKQSTGIQNLDAGSYFDERVQVPGSQTQVAIATALDRETARIDALIEKKTRFIELLKEKRQALITKAVTKGLDPMVPMKGSGVEWIGEVPVHWRSCALGYSAKIATGGTPSRGTPKYWDGAIPWLKTGEVKYNLVTSAEESISDVALANSAAFLAREGTVLMAMYGMGVTRGRVAVLGIPAAFNQACAGIACGPRLYNWFAFYALWAAYRYVRDLASETSQANLSLDIISKLKIPVPPMEEQLRVVEKLKDQLDKLDGLEKSVASSIDLLKERRSALITAAVTGQIDLREDAA